VDVIEAISDDYIFMTRSGGGGGDWGSSSPPPPPPPPPGSTDVSDFVDSSGIFQHSISAQPADGMWTLTIDAGTIGLTNEGDPLSEITMEETEVSPAPPAEHCNIIGLVCNLGPNGATFNPPTTITFRYNPSEIPENVNDMNLLITFWDADAGEWIQLEGCIVDRATHTISAPLSHFTTFAVLACTRQSNFIITDLRIFPKEVDINGSVIIKALVTNTGDCAGSYEAILKVDGEKVTSEDMILAGGDSKEVTFVIAEDSAGRYSL